MRIIYHNDRKYVLRFDKGEELIDRLIEFAKQESIRGALITGIGGVQEAVVATYDLDHVSYRDTTVHGNLELASLTGTIAVFEEAPILHLHGVIGKEDMTALAGHLRRIIVGGTCEIFLETISSGIMREHDHETGLLRMA